MNQMHEEVLVLASAVLMVFGVITTALYTLRQLYHITGLLGVGLACIALAILVFIPTMNEP